MGGSTDQVARYKLGAALAEAAPYLLLLSATPHQGKTDQFHRLMQLIDRDSFPDESSVTSERVAPFVVRTEKRIAIDAEGNPLFKPRVTRLQPVAWQDRHAAQQKLYEAVTDYVRHGYNQAMAAKQRHIGFLMILMQRLVTSSTAAIRTTLEKRQALLDQPQLQPSLFETADVDEWAELDGQTQVDLAVQTRGWEMEKAEVDTLLELARSTEAQGTDAKAEALLGADLQASAGGERPGAEGLDLHRIRADADDARGVSGKPRVLGRHAQWEHGSRRARPGPTSVLARCARSGVDRRRRRRTEPAVLSRQSSISTCRGIRCASNSASAASTASVSRMWFARSISCWRTRSSTACARC